MFWRAVMSANTTALYAISAARIFCSILPLLSLKMTAFPIVYSNRRKITSPQASFALSIMLIKIEKMLIL